MEDSFVSLTHQSRFTGEGFKPPKGALVKSHGIFNVTKMEGLKKYS